MSKKRLVWFVFTATPKKRFAFGIFHSNSGMIEKYIHERVKYLRWHKNFVVGRWLGVRRKFKVETPEKGDVS